MNQHYRALNPFVWYIFNVNYGGLPGAVQVPCLPRESIDIYSRKVKESRLKKDKMANLQALGSYLLNNRYQPGSSSKKHGSSSKNSSAQRRSEMNNDKNDR